MEKLINHSKRFVKKNASTILTCVGSAGVVVTTVLAVKATPKAIRLIEAAEEKKGEKLTRLETIQVAGMTYAPTAIAGIATIGCIFGANVLNKRTQAALASAYALLDRSYKDYKNKVVEMYGDEADKHVKENIAKDKYEECDIEVGADAKLFYDLYSGRYFESTMEHVLLAEYAINRKISTKDYAYLNDWYDELGIEQLQQGHEFGWSRGSNFDHYWQDWVDFHHEEVTMDDGLECCIISIMQEPIMEFEEYC